MGLSLVDARRGRKSCRVLAGLALKERARVRIQHRSVFDEVSETPLRGNGSRVADGIADPHDLTAVDQIEPCLSRSFSMRPTR